MDQFKFGSDPMMKSFLADLDAFQRQQLLGGNKAKQPMPSSYSGGDQASEKLMRELLERILNQQFAAPSQPNKDEFGLNFGAATAGESGSNY